VVLRSLGIRRVGGGQQTTAVGAQRHGCSHSLVHLPDPLARWYVSATRLQICREAGEIEEVDRNLAILGDNGLPFIRDIAYAGNDIVNHIAAANNLAPETVKKTLTGAEDAEQDQSVVFDSLEEACRQLINDVNETLRYYTVQAKSTVIEKIFVCGGFGKIKRFVEVLDKRLSAKAILWNPSPGYRAQSAGPID